MFKGSMVALITPMRADGSVDEKAFVELVQWQIAEGTEGLIPVGTTGESPTLSHEEHMRVVELCVEAAAGRVPVIAGTGSNSTSEAIEFTRHAKKAGAVFAYGSFITVAVNFAILAFIIFMMVKQINRLKKAAPAAPAAAPVTPEDVLLLREIRDNLKK